MGSKSLFPEFLAGLSCIPLASIIKHPVLERSLEATAFPHEL